MTLLPVTETTASFDITSLVQYGVLGIVLILVLFGYLWAKPSVDRILTDKAKAEKQRDDLLDIYQTKVIPVLNEVKDHVVPGMAKIFEQQDALGDKQDALGRTLDQVLDEVKRLSR